MKKFVIFCIASIVIATLGLMTYRFLTLEESLVVNQTVFEINIGDELPLEVEHINPKATTVVVYESLNEEVIEVVNYLGEQKFVTTGEGGKAVLRISANMKNFAPIIITVTVGDGKESTPFFVKDAETLASIGKVNEGEEQAKYALDGYYSLTADIDLSTYNEGEWTPIGKGTENGFTGTFNGNGHTISGLKITQGTDYAGLFAKIGANKKKNNNIYGNLVLANCDIEGNFDYVGALAGFNSGKVSKVSVENSNIASTKAGGVVGGVVGLHTGELEKAVVLQSDITNSASNSIAGGIVGVMTQVNDQSALMMSYCSGVDVSAVKYVGGIVGNNKSGLLGACYAVANGTKGQVSNISALNTACVGGIVGRVEMNSIENEAEVDDCYSTVALQISGNPSVGNLIGYIKTEEQGYNVAYNHLYGLYYDKTLNGYFGIGSISGTKVSSRTQEENAYEFIFDTLQEQSSVLTEKYYSYETFEDYRMLKIYWNFNLVFVDNDDAYPTINNEGIWQSVYPYSVKNPQLIQTAADLIYMRHCVNAPDNEYEEKLANSVWTISCDLLNADENDDNIYLSSIGNWEPIGTEERPFNGTLTCKTNANGEPLSYIIGLNVASVTGSENKGLFGVIGGSGKVMNIYIETPTVVHGRKIGAIAGTNYGVISNCQVISSNNNGSNNMIQTGDSKYVGSEIFIGGLVGINGGQIANSKVSGVKVAINIKASAGYLGGIAGLNDGSIINCSVVRGESGSSNIIEFTQKCQQYVGGITGYNNGTVSSCYINDYDKIAASYENDNTFIGGVVGLNSSSGNILKSFAKALNIDGTNVGGVVSVTYGKVEQCYFDGRTITGEYVGGIAYIVANGTVNDCYANGKMLGYSDKSVKAGFAYEVSLVSENEKLASMNHCYSSMSFDEKGKNYCDTQSAVRADKLDSVFIYIVSRRAGFLFNSIYDRSLADESIATRSDSQSWPWDHNDYRDPQKLISDYNSDRSLYSYKYDTGMTTEEIKSLQGANVFRTYGFDESIWVLDGENYPTLRNVPQVA